MCVHTKESVGREIGKLVGLAATIQGMISGIDRAENVVIKVGEKAIFYPNSDTTEREVVKKLLIDTLEVVRGDFDKEATRLRVLMEGSNV